MAEPKEIALDHFEKVGLGLALLCLGFVGVGMAGKPEALKATQKVATQLKQVKQHMSNKRPDEEKLEDRVAVLKKNLSKENVAKVEAFPAWSLHRRPGVITPPKKEEERQKPVHEAPTGVKGNADDRSKIVLSWSDSPGNAFVVVTEYKVQRKEGKEGEWKDLAAARNGETTYADKDLQPRKSYFYRVISLAQIDGDSPTVRRQKLTLAPDQAEQASNEVGPFTTARDVYLVPQSVDPVTKDDLIKDRNAKAKAYVYVYKWDQAAGEFLKKGFPAEEGKEIGQADVNMRVAGQRKKVNFKTGAKLVTCREEQRPGKFEGQKITVGIMVVEWPDGSKEEVTTQDKAPSKE